ncbi:MAG TPA: TonB-dependent receptor [Bacteroidia bacterium]|jgi:iron complex outermembrane receptor protein|nr:TonB-dependent receptor [Bacteroidia bacterium]
MKHVLLIVAVLAAFHIKAQTSLGGTVLNKQSKEPLPGAVIYFPDLKTGVSSNIDGKYEVKNLPKIKTLMQVKMLGFKTLVKVVDLAVMQSLNIEMEESAVEAEEIVVTGTSHSTEIKRNPVPMALIDQKFLMQTGATNIIDAMIKTPGISALSSGPNISKPYIRGLGYNRVLTLFDGVRQDGQQWGDEHGIEVDQFLVDRIEVIKGPASLIYGSDALAGVVNLLPANPVTEGSIKGAFLSNYQTNNKQIANSFALAGNTNGFVWGMRASHKQAADYQNKYDGRVYGTKYRESDANIFLGLNKSWGYSHLNFTLYDNQQEVPDGSRDSTTRKFTKQITEADTVRPIVSETDLSSYKIAVIHQRVQHYRVYSDNSFILGQSKLGLKLGLQQSHRREFAHPQNADVAGLNLFLNTFTYDVKYYLPEIKGFGITLGVNGMFQQNKNTGATEFVIPDYKSLDAGPFVFVKKSFGKLDFAAGMRYDVRSFQSDSMFTKLNSSTGFNMQTSANPNDTTVIKQFGYYKHTFSGMSGSVGATYNINDNISLKANIARGYRSPNIAEISAKGVHPGTGFEQLGNANFKPEFNLQEDIGVFFGSEHISGSIEVFNNVITNYIYNEKLKSFSGKDSVYIQNGNPYPVFKFKQTVAQLYGGEFSFDIHPHPLDWLHFENSASLIYAANLGGSGAIITDSTKYLPYIPPFHTNSELRADFKKKLGCFSSVYVKVGMQYYAAQNRAFLAYGTETKTPGYTLFDAGLGMNIVTKKRAVNTSVERVICSFYISISNLTDVAYQSNMSRLKYFDNYPNNYTGRSGIYSMGRNISFKLVIPIDAVTKK